MRQLAAIWAICILTLTGCGTKVVDYRIESLYTVSDPQFAQTMGNILGPG